MVGHLAWLDRCYAEDPLESHTVVVDDALVVVDDLLYCVTRVNTVVDYTRRGLGNDVELCASVDDGEGSRGPNDGDRLVLRRENLFDDGGKQPQVAHEQTVRPPKSGG